MIDTAEYGLAKYLDSLIKPHIPKTYMLNSTSSFIDRLFQKVDILVSFDVVSLFTNIPLAETIDLVCNYVYEADNKPPFSKKTFKELLKKVTGGYFLYKNDLYCQIDGVTMGSPLGPTLANFFMANFEVKFMNEKALHTPKLYLRYVDDIFCVFGSMEYLLTFFDCLNELHKNLKFTHEIGPNHLAFLDTEIGLPSDNCDLVSSTVYRKPSNTNVILNYAAVCPITWKLGLITCFINRAFVVCSSWQLFDLELNRLKDIFAMNGYPRQLIDRCIGSFLDKKLPQPQSRILPVDSEYLPIICLPYVGHPSLHFKKRLVSIYRSVGINVRVVFKSFRVGRYFSLKSPTPFALKAKVIYKFTGSCDRNISYIGKTKRHLAIRAEEHFSKRSAILDHLNTCQKCKNSVSVEKNFSILTTAQNEFDLSVKEALKIKQNRPVLNRQLANDGSSYLLKIF